MIKEAIPLILKGAAMGAANVIPGVSGGTVAFVTGIYDRLINAIKSFNIEAMKLLLKGNFSEFAKKTDLSFLICIGIGVAVSVVSLAKVLEYLFETNKELVFAFFFGLILGSVVFVGKKVAKWSPATISSLLIGTGIAVAVAFLPTAEQNSNFFYLVLCGVIAMSSMIIPGLSGSFVLILLGNYELILKSVSSLVKLDPSALKVFIPVGIGAVIGLLTLSHLLSWIFKRHHDVAVALLTGFVAGSLLIIWPWKKEIPVDTSGAKSDTVRYEGWNLPGFETETFIAVALMVVGFIAVWLMEKFGAMDNDAA